ncbi:MAG: ABC transporter ATP-binding protein [Anaerorhabdus sp.]
MSVQLKLKNVSKIYKSDGNEVAALRDINLEIKTGERIFITGESGAGKSTLINIIGCLDRDFDGEYEILGDSAKRMGGKDIANLRNQFFGFIFQEYELIENYTVTENIEIPLVYKRSKKDKKQSIDEILSLVSLESKSKVKVKHLSGGQRQRVAIARALINGPLVIIADEPTGSLDEKNKEKIIDLILNCMDDNSTLILVTHDLSLVKYATRHIELKDGLIVSDKIINNEEYK